MADQLPKTGLRVGATVHQHCEPADCEEGTVTAAGGEHVAAGAGQLEETDSGGRRQEVERGWWANGAADKGGELPHGLNGRQHLRGIDVEGDRTPRRLVSQESLPPLGQVGTAERQAGLGGGGGKELLIYELNTEETLSRPNVGPKSPIQTHWID